MNKKTIITILLAFVAMAGQAKAFKTIKNPVAMACVNVSNGELKAREVIFRDTATTVHFTMEYSKGQSFQFVSSSYLMDEDGNRYPLRSAVPICFIILSHGRGRQPLPIALCRGTETQHMGAVTREWNHRVYHAFRTFAEEDADIRLHRGRRNQSIQTVGHPR